MKKLSVVIPALNEEKGIEKTIASIPKAELRNMGYDVEIIVVDNGSTDRTSEIASNAKAVVCFEKKRGYGAAYKTGFSKATGDIISTTDADGTYPLNDLPRFIEIINNEDVSFLTTNRFPLMEKNAMSFRNKIGNTILSLTILLFYGIRMRDPESGMWIFKKAILNELKCGSDSWPFSHEIKLEACFFNKFSWKELPIIYGVRFGQTNLTMGWKVGFMDLFHIIRKRFIR